MRGANGGIAYVAHGYVGVARGSHHGFSFDGSGSVDDASETVGNHAVEGANGVVCVAHVADSGIGVAYGRDNGGSVHGSGSVDDAVEAVENHAVEVANLIMQLKLWEIMRLRIQIWRITCYDQIWRMT